MKKHIIKLFIVICLLCAVALTVTACKGVKMTISFVVDGETYSTIDTSGNEIVVIPQSPTKDGYTFDGWYWDNGTWQRPFTANSLLNEPLTADMSVYAKFTEIHMHSLTLQPANEATCVQQGNNAYYTCTCGKLFADEQGNQELTAIPTTDIVVHTPSEWITDSEPTCTANGSKHTECVVCHTTLQNETIPSNGHTPETEWKIDSNATCTVNGSKHLECSICHTTLQTETIQASGHTPETEWKIDSNATCTVNGSKHLECSVCHTTLQTETIPSTGHTYSTEWVSDARGHWHVATCEHTSETTTIESHTYDKNYKCKVCNYQDTSLHGTAIATEIFDVDGETLYAKVPNAQTTFSFINAIQVADDATFVVATDLAASNVIRTKTVSLEIGDNTYYVLVENGNDIQLYTVTLRRRPIYTVTFATNGGTACDSQQVEEDSCATEPTTTKTGYTFAGWDYDFEQAITANTIITASWTANEYIVTYDVNGGVLIETEYTATYDSVYTLAVPTREGHTFQGWYVDDTKITNANGQSISSWTYVEDKTATAQWSINSYSLTITKNINTAGTVTGAGTKVYNSEVTVTATEPNLGHEWLGWYNGEELITTELMYSFSMLAKALNLTANYKLRNEMSNFNFTSTLTTCNITGVKEKTITEITIPEYVTSIGNSAFQNCSGLEKVYWNATACTQVGIYESSSCDYTIFKGCTKFTTVVIGDNVNTIPSYAFRGCSSLTSVTIGDSVTSIGSSAFYNCSGLTSVTIPDSVTTIGNSAFEYCSSLTSVIIGNSVTSIGNSAFEYCSSLASVTIGNGVTSIGYYAFRNCSNLTSVTIPDRVMSISSSAFYNCSNLETVYWNATACASAGSSNSTIFYGCSKLTIVVIGNGVTSIGGYAFYNCSNLTSVYYTGDIASWCNISFSNGSANPLYNGANLYIDNKLVTELVIPDTVTEIKPYAFYGCTSPTSVTIGDSVTSIGSSAFAGCSSLESITLPFVGNSIKTSSDKYQYPFGYLFGANSYTGGVATKQYYYGSSTTSSTSTTYYIPSSLKVVTILGGNILYGAFYNCGGLTAISVQYGVTSIGNDAFYNCSSLTNIIIPDSVTSIGYAVFRNCSSLTDVTISDSITSIGDYAFYGCSSLTSVIIGNSVTSIGNSAFRDCSGLTNVYYTGDIESWCNIGFGDSYANPLYYAHNLYIDDVLVTELVIPDTVTEIKSLAFYSCTSITSVTIGNDVTTIGVAAFYDCNNLTSVYYTGDLASWCNISFVNNPLYYAHNLYIDNELVTELVIPNTITEIKPRAFYGCTSITSVTMPDSVTSIGDYAFDNCSSLTSVYYTGDIAGWCGISSLSIMSSSCTLYINNQELTGELVIPDTVTSIKSYAFYHCTSITSVTIGNSVTSIGYSAFYNCSNLECVYYMGTAYDWSNISIDNNNSDLTNATRYYYSETEPELNADGTAYNGNYWYYNDNHEIVVWTYKKEN